jgi:hypothetical protein
MVRYKTEKGKAYRLESLELGWIADQLEQTGA